MHNAAVFSRAKKHHCDTIKEPKQTSQASTAFKDQYRALPALAFVMLINDRLKDEYKY